MTVVSVVERVTPTCRRCGAALRLANSIQSGHCCCHRGTCGDFEAPGCVVCGREIDGIDVVVGICSRCSIVASPSPVAAVTPGSAATGQDRRGPSTAAEAGRASKATGEGADPRVPGTQDRSS